MNIYIVGAGGVGSWLVEAMARLVDVNYITIIDGDTLEEKNLDRQLFTEGEIGSNKAEALASRLGCKGLPEWYSPYRMEHSRHDWVFCCVDNSPSRVDCLKAADMHGSKVIIAANEVHSSEAYAYLPEWQGNPRLDPRLYYPELLSDNTGHPGRAAAGCTGEAQRQNRQLVTANFMAAALASHLYVVWAMEARKLKPESRAFLPHRLNQNLTRSSYVLRGEEEKTNESK